MGLVNLLKKHHQIVCTIWQPNNGYHGIINMYEKPIVPGLVNINKKRTGKWPLKSWVFPWKMGGSFQFAMLNYQRVNLIWAEFQAIFWWSVGFWGFWLGHIMGIGDLVGGWLSILKNMTSPMGKITSHILGNQKSLKPPTRYTYIHIE